ncbi:serine/threonine-protein kinase [Pseudonocardia acaciae]|uniref:serine/threonine-protein kinase n=1 Tax=Pseudonocardia acaciae TaxID=551276 RepID=UPI0006868118|nr:serine/threonine-protein kinase [Pseudonocardia acaciae]
MSAPGSTPEDTEPRRIAERYRLTEPLGAGAMGTVWSGYDEVLHRAVAIKELRVPPGVPKGEMESMRERMMREARTLGGLSHPNVITLYDVVDVSGDPFVVMELLPSRNLSEVIGEQGRLGIGQAASVGLATAAALQAAHRAGITHRDVKPGNVLVAHDGRIKLTDFGIARKRDDVTMTATGLVLGSPAYIAPEVAAGQDVTPAADLWGLGATLFAAVEARPPYDVDGDPVKTVTAVVHGDVPRVHVGGPLADVIAALMVKEPDQRMALSEVRRRLRPLLADPDDPLFPGSADAFSPPPSAPLEQDVGPQSPPEGMNGSSARGTSSGMAAPAPPPAQTGSGHWNARSGATPLSTQPGPLPAPPRQDPQRPPPAQSPPGGMPARRPRPSWQPAPGPGMAPNRPPMARQAPPAPRPQAKLSARLAMPLALAGALAVVGGAGVGWVATRVLVGQSPWSTSVVSPAGGQAVQLKPHVDSTQRYGNSALGFNATVPNGWEEYRLVGDNDVMSVRYVSPDGSRELRFDKTPGTRTHPAQAAEFVNGLTPAGLGVSNVTVLENAGNQIRYRTNVTGARGAVSRVTYAQLTQQGTDLWVVRLTVPADRAGTGTQQLFTSIVKGFRP